MTDLREGVVETSPSWRARFLRGADDRPRTTLRQDLITCLLSSSLFFGLLVDGWSHINLGDDPGFFTLSHALFYAGYAACLIWVIYLIGDNTRRGRTGLGALPQGYGLALAGVVIHGAGGISDMIWHLVIGRETTISALYSPTHLLLFVGMFLIFSSPFRSAWSSKLPAASPWPELLPALWSIALVTALCLFFTQHFFMLRDLSPGIPSGRLVAAIPAPRAQSVIRTIQMRSLIGVIWTTMILVAPVLLLVRRWRLPAGAVTALYTFVLFTLGALFTFRPARLFIVLPIVGVLADVLVHATRTWSARLVAHRLIGFLIPVTLAGLYFLSLSLRLGIYWPIPLWTGAILFPGLVGAGISTIMWPFTSDGPRGLVGSD